MKSSGEIRRAARNVLAGNWGDAVAVSLLVMVISTAVSFVISTVQSVVTIFGGGFGSAATIFTLYGMEETDSVIFPILGTGMLATLGIIGAVIAVVLSVLSTLVTANLQTGQARFFVNLAGGGRPGIAALFSQFSCGFFKAFGLCWYIALRVFLWMLAGYIPGIIMICIGSAISAFTPVAAAVLMVVGILAAASGYILVIIAGLRYSMAYYVLADNCSVGIREAANRSAQLMRGNKGRFFILELSFVGWAILCLFTCGIGNIFLTPYMYTSYAVFYCELIGRPAADNTAQQSTRGQGTYYQNSYNADTATDTSETASPAAEAKTTVETVVSEQTPETQEETVQEVSAEVSEVPAAESTEVDISKIGEGAPSIEEIGGSTASKDENSEAEK